MFVTSGTKHFKRSCLARLVSEVTWRHVDCGHRSLLPVHLDSVKNSNNLCRILEFVLQISVEIKPGDKVRDKCKKKKKASNDRGRVNL